MKASKRQRKGSESAKAKKTATSDRQEETRRKPARSDEEAIGRPIQLDDEGRPVQLEGEALDQDGGHRYRPPSP